MSLPPRRLLLPVPVFTLPFLYVFPLELAEWC